MNQSLPPVSPSRRWLERLPLFAAGVVALAPLVLFHRDFAELFWFGDEFDLIDQIDRLGFWSWMWLVFAENFVPFFKLLWGGGVHLFRGDYFSMIVMLWLTHAFNAMQLGRVLRAHDFPWSAVLFTQLVFALTPASLETLGWTVQWSAVLATTFLLLALEWHARHAPHLQSFTWRVHGPLFAFSAASAFSFSRGVLTGAILALASFWPFLRLRLASLPRRVANAALCLLPAVIAAALIATYSGGNYQQFHVRFADAAHYGLWHFSLNPLHRLLEMDSSGPRTVTLLGAAKAALILWGLARSRGSQRTLLVLLLAFDLGNSTLLGIGRYHTGLETANSSRYQYYSLICVLPFAGLWLGHLLARLPGCWHLPGLAAAALLVVVTFAVSRNWPQEIRDFAFPRGTETRRILLQEPHPPPYAVPGIPFLPTDRAKELIRRYNLH